MKHHGVPMKITDRTFRLAVQIIDVCHSLDTKPGVRRTLSRQLLCSGTSIGANVEEAQAAQSRPDFISKCSIALKECRETIDWRRLLSASKLFDRDSVERLHAEADEIRRILSTIVLATKQGKSS